MKLQPGDIFFQTSGTTLDIIINFFQALWSGDKRSIFSHTGIVVNEDGTTFETSPWRTGYFNLNSRRGRKTIVAILRHTHMRYLQTNLHACYLNGVIYPYWRLPLFALGLAGIVHWRNMVCSEIVADLLTNLGLRKSRWGVSVDKLLDDMMSDPNWEAVYQGFGLEE